MATNGRSAARTNGSSDGVNVKVVLLNNAHLGLVRQQQQLFYGGRYHASRFHAEPDFAQIARGGFDGSDWHLGFNISRKFF